MIKILILLLTISNCNNLISNCNYTSYSSQSTGSKYVNHVYGFSLNIPDGFEYSENFPNSLVTILRKQGEKPDPTNLTLRVNIAKGTLEDYYKYNKSKLKKEMPEAKVVFEAVVIIANYNCYITDVELLNNNVLLHCRLFTFLELGKGFHFSLVSKAKDFDKAKIDFTNILQTLKIE